MPRPLKEVAQDISVLKTKMKSLQIKIKKSILLTNSFQLKIIDMRKKLNGLYLELKEVSELENVQKEKKDSI